MGKFVFTCLVLLAFSLAVSAQTNTEYDKLKKAFRNFEESKYKEAYPYFKEMLGQYPKDPTYQYYAGVCLFNLETNPQQTILYLRHAATKDVPVDVYYYLGKAYLRNYQFEKSFESFELFEINAGRKKLKEFDVQVYKSMAQNGMYLTKYIQKPIVYSNNKYTLGEFYENYQLEGIEGFFVEKQNYLNQYTDSLEEFSVIYVPGDSRERYFVKRNEKRSDYDIYKISQLTDTSWTEPENLGDVINSPFDENFPFLHFDGATLYFASKGHYSMGGYDLYKSTWNWNEQSWTEPENLDFPINSPYDDILFVPTPNKKSAMFSSNRDSDSGLVNTYHIKLASSEPYMEIENHRQILEYASLGVNASIKEEINNTSKPNYIEGKKDLVRIKEDEGFLQISRYDSLLNLAVAYQLKADSLRWVISDQREAFDVTKNGQERAKLTNIIVELEQEIYMLQRKADNTYAEVREIEQLNLASKKAIYEEAPKEEIKPEEYKSNLFYEPTPDSLNIATLVIVEDSIEEDTVSLFDWGLRVETPSIYNVSNPIPLNEDLPGGVIYMIQLGAFSSEKQPSVFKGLTPLSIIKKENSNIRKYFAGKFYQLADAEASLNTVKSKGFRDAYIVAFNSGRIIPVKTAVKLESDKPIKVVAKPGSEVTDTIKTDPEIFFVIKGELNPTDSVLLDSIRLELEGTLEFYIEKENENSPFIIKSFGTFEDAFPLKNKLDAILPIKTEIHAYFDENQIPLEQARKITQ